MVESHVQNFQEYEGPTKSLYKSLSQTGFLYFVRDKRKEVEEMLQLALKGCEEALGPANMLILDTVRRLGTTSAYK